MDYLVTWPDGDEVEYRIVPAQELVEVVECEKNCIVVPLH